MLAQLLTSSPSLPLSDYGIRVVSPKVILPELEKLFNHSDSKVRAETTQLAAELLRWLGAPAMEKTLAAVKPIQRKEVEDLCATLPQPAAPQKLTRSAQAKQAEGGADAGAGAAAAAGPSGAGAAAGANGGAGAAPAEEADPLEFVDPIEVLSKLDEQWEKQVSDTKWTERRDALLALQEFTKVPKLVPGDYAPVVRLLKKVIGKDSNVVVIMEACKCVSNLAAGLKREFGQFAKIVLGVLFDRLKEKKQNVLEAVRTALDTIFHKQCLLLGEAIEEIQTALAAKTPQARAETLSWLGGCLERSRKDIIAKSAKVIGAAIVKTFADGAAEVRDAAVIAFAKFAGCIGERPALAYIDSLEQSSSVMYAKVVAAFPSKAGSAAGAGAPASASASASASAPASAPAPVAAPAAAPATARPSTAAAPAPAAAAAAGAKARPRTAAGPRAAAAPSGGAAAAAGAAGASAHQAEEAESTMTAEEARALLVERTSLDDATFELLNSKNWKERLEAMEKIAAAFKALDDAGATEVSEPAVRFVLNERFKDSNTQVAALAFNAAGAFADKIRLSRRCVHYVAIAAAAKLADVRAAESAIACLTAMSVSNGPSAVMAPLLGDNGVQQKNVKAAEATLKWIAWTVNAFAGAGVNARDLIASVKTALEARDPKVKQAAVDVLVQMFVRLGASTLKGVSAR